jgi:hypothetical protein
LDPLPGPHLAGVGLAHSEIVAEAGAGAGGNVALSASPVGLQGRGVAVPASRKVAARRRRVGVGHVVRVGQGGVAGDWPPPAGGRGGAGRTQAAAGSPPFKGAKGRQLHIRYGNAVPSGGPRGGEKRPAAGAV